MSFAEIPQQCVHIRNSYLMGCPRGRWDTAVGFGCYVEVRERERQSSIYAKLREDRELA